MAKPKPLPPISKLRQALDYEPLTGQITFREREDASPSWNSRHAGTPAMCSRDLNGYLVGFLFGEQWFAHRIAYALANGSTDIEFVDHINGDRKDNRAANLRNVSYIGNSRNKALSRNSTTGFTGVRQFKNGSFGASITVDHRNIVLGTFGTIEEAIAARKAAEKVIGFHPNHGRCPA